MWSGGAPVVLKRRRRASIFFFFLFDVATRIIGCLGIALCEKRAKWGIIYKLFREECSRVVQKLTLLVHLKVDINILVTTLTLRLVAKKKCCGHSSVKFIYI